MVAEALGAAILTVSVDDTQLRAGLAAIQQDATRTAQIVQQAFSRTGAGPQANGLRDYQEATQRAQQAAERQTVVVRQQADALIGSGNAARAAGAGFEALTGVLARLGAATSAVAVGGFIANQVQQLDEASAAVRTLGVDSNDLKERLRNLSVELNSNVSQVELTKAAYDVASSGFASAGEATDILRAAALGAKGGFADINDVARALTGVLNAYGMTAEKATGIVDQFIQTQADGVITVRQYANEIGNVSSIAAAAGIPLEELNAAVATATLRGVPVQQTFTGLRQAISSILKPSEQAASLARALGVDFSVSALKTKGFGGVLADIQAKGGGAADKLAILLGSVEAQAAVQPLLNDGLAKYNDLLARQAKSTGEAAKASQINSNTISGGLKQIGNGFVNLATTLDTVLTPLFGGFIKSINEVLNKLNQVAALAPEKVRAREKQATDIVAANLGFLGIKGSGFFGAITVQYGGKTYKGSATGIREAIIQDLLKKDIAALNRGAAPNAAPRTPAAAPGTAPAPQVGPVVDRAKLAADLLQIRQSDALEIEGIRARTRAAGQLVNLSERERRQLETKLGIQDKIRDVRQIEVDLARELAKPAGDGITNREGSRDEERIARLEGRLSIATARVKQAYAEAGAQLVRDAREAAAETRAILGVFRGARDQATALERDRVAAVTGLRSPIDEQDRRFDAADLARGFNPGTGRALRNAEREGARRVAAQVFDLQNNVADATTAAARAALDQQDALRRRAAGEPVGRQELARLAADADIAGRRLEQAGAVAGRALKDNATEAAKQLREAQSSFNDVLRGGFQFLNPRLQQQQLDLARREFQPLVNRGIIREGVPVQTPEQVFGLASFARQFNQAEENLALARSLKTAADEAARNTTGLIENAKAMGVLSVALDELSGKDWTVNVAVTPPTAELPAL